MNGNLRVNRMLSVCLSVALITSYSTAALGGSEKIAGEISVSGKIASGQNPFVKINGENVQSGRSVFTDSTIATPDNATAIVNLGKTGRIELAPNTIIQLSFNNEGIKGNLSAGRVTVLTSTNGMTVTTPDGKTIAVDEGDSASTASAQTDDENGGGSSLLIYAAILGGAVAGIIFAATSDNKIALGGGSTVVSTNR